MADRTPLFLSNLLIYCSSMSPEDKSVLMEIVELSRENNKMLRSIRNASRWARAWRVFYWIVIIVVTLGSYYFVQPYIAALRSVYSGFQENVDQMKQVTGKITSVGDYFK